MSRAVTLGIKIVTNNLVEFLVVAGWATGPLCPFPHNLALDKFHTLEIDNHFTFANAIDSINVTLVHRGANTACARIEREVHDGKDADRGARRG